MRVPCGKIKTTNLTRCSVIGGSTPPIRTCRSELFSKRSAYDELNSAAGEAESVLIFRKQAEWQSATNARRRLGWKLLPFFSLTLGRQDTSITTHAIPITLKTTRLPIFCLLSIGRHISFVTVFPTERRSNLLCSKFPLLPGVI